MTAYRSELPHDGVHGVSFGTPAALPHPASSAPLLPIAAAAAHFLLVLGLLSPLWLTGLYAWQRAAARRHGSLRGWQDATPPAHRGLLLPLKALAWAAARHVDSRLPPQLSQAHGHALVASEEEEAEAEVTGAGTTGLSLERELQPARETEPWYAEMLAASYARATEATASDINAGAGRRRTAREPQVLAPADLEQSPMETQLALAGVAAVEAAEGYRAASVAAAAERSAA